VKKTLSICFSIQVLAFASIQPRAEPSAGTNAAPEHAAAAAVQPGDPFDRVIRALGDPRVDCPLGGGKRLLIYEQGEIHLRDDRVVSIIWLSDGELEEKRELQRRRKAAARSDTPDRKPAARLAGEKDTGAEIAQMRTRLAELQRDRSFSRKMASMHMSQTLDYFSLMVKQGGSAKRHTKHLLNILPNNSLDDFYYVEFDFEFYERRYSRNPEALLSLHSMRREQALFLDEYKKLKACEQELTRLQHRLERLERHGY
jgi:hypothetical protein